MLTDVYLERCRYQVKVILDHILPKEQAEPCRLHQAMRYSVFNGGKRLRPAFIYALGQSLGVNEDVLDELSAAIEMIHAYSLIHDDLPALDNDDLRRGKPTCHKVFGEATAILTGDALQSLAFETIANIKGVKPEQLIEMIKVLSHAVGSLGMIGGEELDIEMVNQHVETLAIEIMYQFKTSCLLTAGMMLAALAAERVDKDMLFHIQQFGDNLGVAFQIHDDILGIESDTATLGKQQGADLELNKPVYPVLVGLKQAKIRRNELFDKALKHLKQTRCDDTMLQAVSRYVIDRNH